MITVATLQLLQQPQLQCTDLDVKPLGKIQSIFPTTSQLTPPSASNNPLHLNSNAFQYFTLWQQARSCLWETGESRWGRHQKRGHIYICIIIIWEFSSVSQSCPTLCNPVDCSTPGFSVHPQLPELAQTHVHRAGDAIQPYHPLSSTSPPAFNLAQHQGLFQ